MSGFVEMRRCLPQLSTSCLLKEHVIFSKMLRRAKNQQRHDLSFQKMTGVSRKIKKYLTVMNLQPKLRTIVRELFTGRISSDTVETVEEMYGQLLETVTFIADLLPFIEDTWREVHQRLQRALFVPFNTVMLSSLSRLWVCLRLNLLGASKTYMMLTKTVPQAKTSVTNILSHLENTQRKYLNSPSIHHLVAPEQKEKDLSGKHSGCNERKATASTNDVGVAVILTEGEMKARALDFESTPPIQSVPILRPHIQPAPILRPHIQSVPILKPHIQSAPILRPHIQSAPILRPHIQSVPILKPHIQPAPILRPHIQSAPILRESTDAVQHAPPLTQSLQPTSLFNHTSYQTPLTPYQTPPISYLTPPTPYPTQPTPTPVVFFSQTPPILLSSGSTPEMPPHYTGQFTGVVPRDKHPVGKKRRRKGRNIRTPSHHQIQPSLSIGTPTIPAPGFGGHIQPSPILRGLTSPTHFIGGGFTQPSPLLQVSMQPITGTPCPFQRGPMQSSPFIGGSAPPTPFIGGPTPPIPFLGYSAPSTPFVSGSTNYPVPFPSGSVPPGGLFIEDSQLSSFYNGPTQPTPLPGEIMYQAQPTAFLGVGTTPSMSGTLPSQSTSSFTGVSINSQPPPVQKKKLKSLKYLKYLTKGHRMKILKRLKATKKKKPKKHPLATKLASVVQSAIPAPGDLNNASSQRVILAPNDPMTPSTSTTTTVPELQVTSQSNDSTKKPPGLKKGQTSRKGKGKGRIPPSLKYKILRKQKKSVNEQNEASNAVPAPTKTKTRIGRKSKPWFKLNTSRQRRNSVNNNEPDDASSNSVAMLDGKAPPSVRKIKPWVKYREMARQRNREFRAIVVKGETQGKKQLVYGKKALPGLKAIKRERRRKKKESKRLAQRER